MRRIRACSVSAAVGLTCAAALAGAVGATTSFCCIAPAPTYTADPATRKVILTFVTPANYEPVWLIVSRSGTLGPAGNVKNDAGAPPVTASPYTYTDWGTAANGWPTVLYFQIAYGCKLSKEECPGGEAVRYGTPVKVDITAAAKDEKPAASAQLGEVPKSNGTKACETARARIKRVNGEIQKALANLRFADKLRNPKTKKVRQQQLQQRLKDLQVELAQAVAAGKKAC